MRPLLLIILTSFTFVSCSNDSDDLAYTNKKAKGQVVFSAIGDVPYTDEEEIKLREQIVSHNDSSISDFVIHLGDIKTGAQECNEERYVNVSTLLKDFKINTFIIPGDNEYNDCEDPANGWFLWRSYFYRFHEFWNNKMELEYQEDRGENFSFFINDILFIGLNIVGGKIHDQEEWNLRLTQNGDWYQRLVTKHGSFAKAIVVFGHANIVDFDPEKYDLFTNKFREVSAKYNKPVLYLHGDGHTWIKNRPWDEKNILRVQVDEGGQILQVQVDPNEEEPFLFNRKPF